jgi:hypothetical protein
LSFDTLSLIDIHYYQYFRFGQPFRHIFADIFCRFIFSPPRAPLEFSFQLLMFRRAAFFLSPRFHATPPLAILSLH